MTYAAQKLSSPHGQAWEVLPVRLGTMTVDTSQLLRGRRLGEKVAIPCIAWVLRRHNEVIVVDTGPSGEEWSGTHHNPMVRPPAEGVVAAFSRVGVDVATVKTVINTHLHWDHCYGNQEFPEAVFYVQRQELEYANSPHPCDAPIYESNTAAPFRITSDRYIVIDGEYDVSDGVRLVPIPGHTPGHQGVLVRGAQNRIFIAGDAVGLYENLEEPSQPGTLYTDLGDWYRSIHTMRENADIILPGHDPRVFDKESYT